MVRNVFGAQCPNFGTKLWKPVHHALITLHISTTSLPRSVKFAQKRHPCRLAISAWHALWLNFSIKWRKVVRNVGAINSIIQSMSSVSAGTVSHFSMAPFAPNVPNTRSSQNKNSSVLIACRIGSSMTQKMADANSAQNPHQWETRTSA